MQLLTKKNLGECASDESTWTGHRHPSLICGLSWTFWEPPDPLILLLHVVKRNNYGWLHSCVLKQIRLYRKKYFCSHKISSMVLHIGRLNLHTSSTVVVVKAAAASTES